MATIGGPGVSVGRTVRFVRWLFVDWLTWGGCFGLGSMDNSWHWRAIRHDLDWLDVLDGGMIVGVLMTVSS